VTPFEAVAYEPARRDDVVALFTEVWGTWMAADEFSWWFDDNPVQPRIVSLAQEDGALLGALGMSMYRAQLGGREQLVCASVHGATRPQARGKGIFSALELRNEELAAAAGAVAVLAFSSERSTPIFLRLGWRDLASLRVWAHVKRLRRSGRGSLRGGVQPRFDERHADCGAGNRFLKDAAYLNWRYSSSPRPYRLVESGEEYAVVGYTVRRGFATGVICELRGGRRALRRAVRAVDAEIVVGLPNHGEHAAYLAAGFVPTPETLRFMGKPLADVELPAARGAWRLTLGDTDFF
jgi:hypothetical protein